MRLTSPAFSAGGEIPTRYTCDGEDLAPPLAWTDVPDGTRSFVLIVDDPDAPDPDAPLQTWVHWVLYNIPPHLTGLPEGFDPGSVPGVGEGWNDFGRTAYGGPCPPVGTHRYFHKLYALDGTIAPAGGASKADVEEEMQGAILARAELIGTYARPPRTR